MALAAATEGRSSATISRSRECNDTSPSSRHQPRHFHQPFKLRPKQVGDAGVSNVVHVIERAIRALDRNLFGYHQRATAELEDLAQSHQRTETAGTAGRGRCNREHASLEGGISWIPSLTHARDPIDGVLEH